MAEGGGLTPAEFRAIRIGKGLSQTDLAKVLGVDPHTVSDWEVGKHPIPGPAKAFMALWESAAGNAWQPIETAPRDGTAFQARIPGNGEDNVICWQDGLIDSNGNDCGAWCFASEQEPPDCWTDGWCWEVNADLEPSVKPTHWLPLPPPPGESK